MGALNREQTSLLTTPPEPDNSVGEPDVAKRKFKSEGIGYQTIARRSMAILLHVTQDETLATVVWPGFSLL